MLNTSSHLATDRVSYI